MIAELFHWLATPISGASDHAIAMPLAWHGRLMVLAMGLLTPPLIIVARFFKIMPRQDWPRQLDNPFCYVSNKQSQTLTVSKWDKRCHWRHWRIFDSVKSPATLLATITTRKRATMIRLALALMLPLSVLTTILNGCFAQEPIEPRQDF